MVDKIDDKVEFDLTEDDEEQEIKALDMDDFKGGNYLKNPEVGQSIEFTVEKVIQNPNVTGKNSEGIAFAIGVTDKSGKVKRIDLETDQGIYTINTWEVYFKLFDSKPKSMGILLKYALEHNKSFEGAKIRITRQHDGSHARMKLSDLQKIKGFASIEETKKYQEELKEIMKERKLYEVILVK
jgi:hypothetical protein